MKSKKIIISSIAGALIVLVSVVTAVTGSSKPKVVEYHADHVIYNQFDELFQKADLVVRVKVNSNKVKNIDISIPDQSLDEKSSPSKNAPSSKKNSPSDFIYTVSEVTITEVYKGDIKKNDKIEVKQLGGQLDNVTYVDKDVKHFKVNDEEILFLTKYNNFPYSILNPVQGAYDINADNIISHENNKIKIDKKMLEAKSKK